MNDTILVRPAVAGDEPIISHHRARMFRDMGVLPDDQYDEMHATSVAWHQRLIASGEYVGWLAYVAEHPEQVVGGAGMLLRVAPPTVAHRATSPTVREGVQALVINVFTEPQWRRRGVAALLMQQLIDDARARNVINVVLHASDDGRALYESLGFVPTNEMRLADHRLGSANATT